MGRPQDHKTNLGKHFVFNSSTVTFSDAMRPILYIYFTKDIIDGAIKRFLGVANRAELVGRANMHSKIS